MLFQLISFYFIGQFYKDLIINRGNLYSVIVQISWLHLDTIQWRLQYNLHRNWKNKSGNVYHGSTATVCERCYTGFCLRVTRMYNHYLQNILIFYLYFQTVLLHVFYFNAHVNVAVSEYFTLYFMSSSKY